MTLAGTFSVLIGGGCLWKALSLLGRYTQEPGPTLALSSANVVPGEWNSVYPAVLQIENIGNKSASEITLEIRKYHLGLPPSFETVRENRLIPLQPQHHFLLDVGKDGFEMNGPGHPRLSTAHFAVYEILLWYRGPNKVKYLSHSGIWLGDLKQHKTGLNPLWRAISFIRLRMWMTHFLCSAGIEIKVRWPCLHKLFVGGQNQ